MDFPADQSRPDPALDGAQALFGSVMRADGPIDDRIVDIMVYLYEVLPPEALL